MNFKLQAQPTADGHVLVQFEATVSPSVARMMSTMCKNLPRPGVSEDVSTALNAIADDLMGAANESELRVKN